MEIPKNVCTLTEIKKLQVINLCDGRNLGNVCDVEMSLYQGNITALILPKPFELKSLFQPEGEKTFRVPWDRIERIGADTILARIPEATQ